MEAIAIRLEAIAIRLEAITIRLEATTTSNKKLGRLFFFHCPDTWRLKRNGGLFGFWKVLQLLPGRDPHGTSGKLVFQIFRFQVLICLDVGRFC